MASRKSFTTNLLRRLYSAATVVWLVLCAPASVQAIAANEVLLDDFFQPGDSSWNKAFERAIERCKNGGLIKLGSRTYDLDESVYVKYSSIKILGVGKGASIVKLRPSNIHGIVIGQPGIPVTNNAIESLTITAPARGNIVTRNALLYISDARYPVVTDVELIGGWKGIQVGDRDKDDKHRPRTGKIHNPRLLDIRTSDCMVAIELERTMDCLITQCTLGFWESGIVMSSAKSIPEQGDWPYDERYLVDTVHVSKCLLLGHQDNAGMAEYGILSIGAVRIWITDCVIEVTQREAMKFFSYLENPHSTFLTIRDNILNSPDVAPINAKCIKLENVRQAQITGNGFNRIPGVQQVNCKSVTVTDCRLYP